EISDKKEEKKEDEKPVVDGVDLDIDLSPEPEKKEKEVVNIRLNEKQKQEVINAGIVEDPFEGPGKAIEKLMDIKNIDKESAEVYFNNNLKSLLDEALAKSMEEDKKHASNVEKMKEEAESPEEDAEFNPFEED